MILVKIGINSFIVNDPETAALLLKVFSQASLVDTAFVGDDRDFIVYEAGKGAGSLIEVLVKPGLELLSHEEEIKRVREDRERFWPKKGSDSEECKQSGVSDE